MLSSFKKIKRVKFTVLYYYVNDIKKLFEKKSPFASFFNPFLNYWTLLAFYTSELYCDISTLPIIKNIRNKWQPGSVNGLLREVRVL